MLACGVWLLVFCILIRTLPALAAEILALALVNGHTWGAMTWMVYSLRLDYHVCLLYFALMATVYVLCHRSWLRRNQNR